MSYTTRKASALGRAPLVSTSMATVPTGTRSIEVDPYGGGGGLKPPSGPTGGGSAPPPPRPPLRFPLAPRADRLVRSPGAVKLPGSVLPSEPTKVEPTKSELPEKAPSRGGGVTYGGGGGFSYGGSGPRAVNVGPLEPMPPPVPTVTDEEAPPPQVTAAPRSDNMLLYAAIGVGALWLLTRK